MAFMILFKLEQPHIRSKNASFKRGKIVYCILDCVDIGVADDNPNIHGNCSQFIFTSVAISL